MLTRRELLAVTGSFAVTGGEIFAASVLPRRIAFGSCADQDKPQPIWDAVLASEPDLFVFLGDNIYGDTRDPAVLRAKYARLAAQPGFKRLRERVPVLATWDDHDFGENDAGAEYPMKEESRRIFCDFWGEPADSPRRRRDGIYHAVEYGAAGQRLQILLPDLRFNRTALRPRRLEGTTYSDWSKRLEREGREVPGPYERDLDAKASGVSVSGSGWRASSPSPRTCESLPRAFRWWWTIRAGRRGSTTRRITSGSSTPSDGSARRGSFASVAIRTTPSFRDSTSTCRIRCGTLPRAV